MTQQLHTLGLPTPPPSLNNAFCTIGRKRIKSPGYKSWITAATIALIPQLKGRRLPLVGKGYRLSIEVEPGTSRADLDNLIKPISDLMVRLGITPDDSAAASFGICRKAGVRGVRITLSDAPAVEPMDSPTDHFILSAVLVRRGDGMTQQTVAQACGVTRQAVSLWEQGERGLSLDQACKLARMQGLRLALVPAEGV